ncbi:MAG: hypothetical protein Q4A35_01300 [Candidatus Gracilibacteria bacterium]|nr:hypothetical protein [Candidatus Gracilibacteria bacterium]
MDALGTLGKLAQKPSDAKIRTTRIIFALLLVAVIVFGWNATNINISIFDYYEFYDLPDEIKYILFIFPAVGLVRGIFDPGLFRKAIWKKVITTLGALMMIFSVFFMTEKAYIPNVETPSGGEVTAESVAQAQNDSGALFANVSTDNWIFWFGFVTLIVGLFLNGRNLTTKNEKFGEVIKKIRV